MADDVSTPVNPGGNGEVGAREVNRGKNASAQQKAMGATVGCAYIPSDNVAMWIDPVRARERGPLVIDRGELAIAQ